MISEKTVINKVSVKHVSYNLWTSNYLDFLSINFWIHEGATSDSLKN